VAGQDVPSFSLHFLAPAETSIMSKRDEERRKRLQRLLAQRAQEQGQREQQSQSRMEEESTGEQVEAGATSGSRGKPVSRPT